MRVYSSAIEAIQKLGYDPERSLGLSPDYQHSSGELDA
jgi:hypothetical protein